MDQKRVLMLYVGTGRSDAEGEEIDVETYEAGRQVTVRRGMRVWVDSQVRIVSEAPGGDVPMMDEEEGGLAPGRYRWTGEELVYLGRQKGPARPDR